jgi:cell division protein FtsN
MGLGLTSGCRAEPDAAYVRLQGTVGRVAPLIGGSVYELQTAEGTYTVRSARRDRQPGQGVTIEGRWQVLEPLANPLTAVTEPTAPPRADDQPRFVEEQGQS